MNQERGAIRARERRGMRLESELRDWERKRISRREKARVMEGGFWKARVKRRK